MRYVRSRWISPSYLLAILLLRRNSPPFLAKADEPRAVAPSLRFVLHLGNRFSCCRSVRSPLCRRPLTALRLDVWLRSLLCDADNSHFDVGLDIEKSFPDVFRTSRTLARAIARHASALVTGSNQDERAPRPNGYHQPSYSGGDSGGVERLRPNFVNGTGVGDGGGDRRRQEPAVDELLESPRRALAGRLQSTPAAAALVSWVSSVVKTAKQYRQWLPWQPFADELRELVLLSVRQRSVHQAAGGDGGGAGGRALAAEAAVFAVCELLLAWEETPAVRIDG